MKSVLAAVLFFVLAGCGGFAPTMPREEAYRAFTAAPTDVYAWKTYVHVAFRLSPLLREAEEGSAWYLAVLDKNGELQTHFAVRYHSELVALLPGHLADFEDAYAVIVSHDALFCYNAAGAEAFCGVGLDEFDWQANATLLSANEAVTEITSGSPEDETVTEWLREIAVDEMAARFGTTLSLSEYQALVENGGIGGRTLQAILQLVVQPGVTLGTSWAVTGSWELALTGAGIGTILPILNLLAAVFTPDLDHPEYGVGHPTNRSLARKLLRLEERLRATDERYLYLIDLLAEQIRSIDQTATTEEDALREEIAELRARIEALEADQTEEE
jgi:hypothetical protein